MQGTVLNHTLPLQILGGSFISTGQLASKFARYQFRPHFFQHATFRLVQEANVDLDQYDKERYGPHNPVQVRTTRVVHAG